MVQLGIDIGGSATKGALVDTSTGRLASERIRFQTEPLVKPKEVLVAIQEIQRILDYQGRIGIGYPGIIKNGSILTAANMNKKWIGENLAKKVEELTCQKAVVLNDADAAGLAEMRFGFEEARKYHTVLFLTIGTGIGSAIFVNGKLMPNTELGHLQIRGRDAEHRASDLVRKKEKLSWRKWAARFNEVLQTYTFLFNPDLIIIGGGISYRFDHFKEYLNTNTRVVPAKLQNLAGMIGAAMAAHEADLEVLG